MTCEVPWLRLTDGHAWRTPSRPREETVTPVRPPDLSPVLSVQQIASLYRIPLMLALKWQSECGTRLDRVKWVHDQSLEHGIDQVAKVMKLQTQTIKKMIAEYRRLAGLKVNPHDKRESVYIEFMGGVKTKDLAEKYKVTAQTIRMIAANYAAANGLPIRKNKKRALTQAKS